MLIKMKGTNGQVQTVSIIDTISELASNHGDRAKITQVSKVSSRTSSSSPGTVTSPGGPKFPPPPPPLNPRHPVMSVPPTFLATNISISQMSLPPHNTGVSGTSSMSTILHNSNSSRHKSLMTPTSSGSRHSGNFDDFSSGLNKSGYLNSTMNDMADRRQRRRKKVRNIKTGVRGQGETPDWIKELFNFAKKGNLEKLVSVLLIPTCTTPFRTHHINNTSCQYKKMPPQTLTGYISQQNISSLKLVNGSYHQHWWTSWLSSLLSGPGHNIGHWSLVTDILTLSSWNHPKYRIEQTRTGNWIWWHTPKHFGLLDIASISIVDKDNLILQDMGSLKIFQIVILNFLQGFVGPCVCLYIFLCQQIFAAEKVTI